MKTQINKQIRSLRLRMLLPVMLTMLLTLGMNFFLFYRLNRTTASLQGAYDTNLRLNELEKTLENMEEDILQYLNVRSMDHLMRFRENQVYLQEVLESIDDTITDHPMRGLELQVKLLGLSYLEKAELAIVQKQDHDTTGYRQSYEEMHRIYRYLLRYISGLDALRFRANSENYDILYEKLRFLENYEILVQVLVMLSLMAFLYVIIQEYIEKVRENTEQEIVARERELRMENLLKNAQLKYYQAQINPHFLFNTLNAGQQLAMLEDAERTYTYMAHTAQFFRYRLKKNGEESSLSEEIQLIDHYMHIMNVRFAGEIMVIKEIDEQVLSCPFPGMTLQPIVENALTHGLSTVEWEKEIRIQILQEGEEIHITVSDNGVGMEPSLLEQINTGEYHTEEEHMGSGNGVGLMNVRERLRLYYRKDDVFAVESPGRNRGTLVHIRIPKEQQYV